MSALVGATVRLTTTSDEGESEHLLGVVVAVAETPRGNTYPMPSSWDCLMLVDGEGGTGALRVVDSTRLAVLQIPNLQPYPAQASDQLGSQADELAKKDVVIKAQSLEMIKLEDEAAGLAAEVAKLKKKIKQAPSKGEPVDEEV